VFYPIPTNHGQNITRPGVNVKWVIGRMEPAKQKAESRNSGKKMERGRQKHLEQKGTKTTKGKGLAFLSAFPLVIALDRNSAFWCRTEMRFAQFSSERIRLTGVLMGFLPGNADRKCFTSFPMRRNRLQKGPDRPNSIWPASG